MTFDWRFHKLYVKLFNGATKRAKTGGDCIRWGAQPTPPPPWSIELPFNIICYNFQHNAEVERAAKWQPYPPLSSLCPAYPSTLPLLCLSCLSSRSASQKRNNHFVMFRLAQGKGKGSGERGFLSLIATTAIMLRCLPFYVRA